MAKHNDKELDDFLKKVDEVEILIKNLNAVDDTTRQEAFKKSEVFLQELNEKKNDITEDSDLKQCVDKYNKTLISKNKQAEDGEGVRGDVDRAAFMAAVEEDARIRTEKRQKKLEKVKELKKAGNTEYRSENFEKAIEYYNQALLLIKDDTVLYTNRAQAYIELKRYREAIQDCEMALTLRDSCLKALYHKGRAHLGLNMYGQAMECFTKALELDSKDRNIIKDYIDAIQETKQSSFAK